MKKNIRKIFAGMLLLVMVFMSYTLIYASEEQKNVEDINDQVSVGYIVEIPTEMGKDIYIQLGDVDDIFTNIILVAKNGEDVQSFSADEIIQNTAAFYLEGEYMLDSITGIVNGENFSADLSTLDATEGEEVLVDVESEINVEDYVITDAERNENAIAEILADTSLTTYSLSRTRTKSEFVVVIDPGHSAKSPGANTKWDGELYREEVLVMKIARYLVEELKEYSGVSVYLTRDENSHLGIEDRVKYAQSMNADLLVSIHLNSTGKEYDSASGVLAIVAKIGTYNAENAQEAQAAARKILDELVDLGFRDREFQFREGSETYPDGSPADYYGIIRYGQLYSVPSTIVEHGFLNNESDFRKYLSTEDGLKSLGVADATGIANYFGLQKMGEEKLTGWQIIDGNTYYYGVDGKPVTGTPIIDGKKYWFDARGVRQTGWLYLLDWKMYFDPATGAAKTGMSEIDGKTYMFNEDGVMQNFAGTPIINGKKYWVNMEDYSLSSGWLYLLDWKMYFDPETYEAKVGMADIEGKRYLFNQDGVMQNYAGTTIIDGKKYWFSEDNASLKTGWLRLGDWMLYFDPETYEAAIGIVEVDGTTCVFDTNGVLLNGFIQYDGNKYYYQNGAHVTGVQVIDGEKYAFDNSGKQILGWYTYQNWKFYFDPDNGGAAVTTSIKIEDITYYFNSDGTLAQTSTGEYITLKDPANGRTYTLESEYGTDPVVEDKKFLAAAIYTESGNQTLECQIATGLVILNRMENKSYPSTLQFVVYQKNQFAVARNGALTKILTAYVNNDTDTLKWVKTSEEAAIKALEIIEAYKNGENKRQIDGVTLPNERDDFDYLGFMTPAAFDRVGLDPEATEAFQIDNTMFYRTWVLK